MFICCSYSNFRDIGCFSLCKCLAQCVECTSFSVKTGMNYFQAVTSMKLMQFTVLYTATMKGGKRLLRKS